MDGHTIMTKPIRPILEIRMQNELTANQVQFMTDAIKELFPDYDPLVLDCGMSAHIHDDAILNELREIKQILIQKTTITGQDLMWLCEGK